MFFNRQNIAEFIEKIEILPVILTRRYGIVYRRHSARALLKTSFDKYAPLLVRKCLIYILPVKKYYLPLGTMD